jgi:AsmA protein
MSRRVVFLIALTSLAILGAAAVPWNLTGSRLASTVTRHLRDTYGLDFKVNGQSTFALLPTPRVKFEEITLAFPDHTVKAEGGTLRGELRLLPLLLGRIRLSEIMLSETKITASREALRTQDWAGLLKERLKAAHARRLIVAASSLQWTDLTDGALDKVNLVVSWAGASAPLYAVGSASWRGDTVIVEQASFHPEPLVSDRLSPISLTLSSSAGQLAITGEAQLGSDPQLTGESLIKATSVRELTRWSGIQVPFGSLIQALSIQGEFSLNRRRLTWPSVAVTLGTDKLEGTMAVRFDADRPVVAGTLAAETLDLSSFVRPLTHARTGSGGWSEEAIDLANVTGSDLDLRISATNAQLGRLLVDDMAASVLVRPGRIEASIGRADLHDGTLKGRVSLTSQERSTEIKGQGSFDSVDLAAFLNALGEPRWIRGRAHGQFLVEGSGQTPAEMVRQVRGRTAITVAEGELVGIALDDALRRVEKRPLLAFLNWKGGRTPFDQAHVQVQIDNGIGTITEGRVKAPGLLTNLQGKLSLPDRTLDLKADVSPAGQRPSPTPAIEFDVSGGWDNVVVRPEARTLIERSGAARPLFGPRRSDPAAPAEAVAQ